MTRLPRILNNSPPNSAQTNSKNTENKEKNTKQGFAVAKMKDKNTMTNLKASTMMKSTISTRRNKKKNMKIIKDYKKLLNLFRKKRMT